MITAEQLQTFTEEHPGAENQRTTASHSSERNVPQGIGKSAETLRDYLEFRGLKVKAIKDGKKGERVLVLDGCPMNPDHGRGTDTAVIWRSDGIGFECKHNGCQGYQWSDVRAKIDHDYGIPGSVRREVWEPPIPLGEFELSSFPMEAIPNPLETLREYCLAVAESYQVPVDLPAMLVLAVSAAALAKRIEVHVRGDHREPVNLFVAVAMEPASRKSAVFSAVSEPLAAFEREEAERLAPVIEQSRNDRVTLEMALKHTQQQAARAKKPQDREQAEQQARELIAELREKPVVVSPRYIADDATQERLASLMRDQGGRIALLSPEGDTFDLMAGRYTAPGSPNLGVYLKGHAGDDIRVDRVNKDRPAEYVRQPALTIGLAVQPDVLRGLMSKPGFRGRGLLGRFLYALPVSLLGRRKFDTRPVPSAVASRYHDLIRSALKLAPATDDAGKPTPHIIRVGAEALPELDRFAAMIEKGLGGDGTFANMRDWAGKLVGATCRIAGIFHGLRYAPGRNPGLTPIDLETLLCALGIGEYLIEHARAAYFEMGSDRSIDLARRLVDRMKSDWRRVLTRRDAHRWLRTMVRQVGEVDEPLRLLEAHGYIRELPVERKGTGRPPSRAYEINPLIYGQNGHNGQNSV